MFERFTSFIAELIRHPHETTNSLKSKGKVVAVRSYPYIFALLVGVLFTLVGFRYQQSKIDISPKYKPEPVVEEIAPVVTPTPDPYAEIREEAEYCAKVLYGTAQYNSCNGQRLVVWCIANRVDHENYPNTVKEVCQQEKQWMGYSDDNPVLTNLYDISYEVLTQWHEGHFRDVSPDFIFMTWSSKEIILKDRFEDGAHTHYWYE